MPAIDQAAKRIFESLFMCRPRLHRAWFSPVRGSSREYQRARKDQRQHRDPHRDKRQFPDRARCAAASVPA